MTLELGWYVPTAKQCAPRWLLAASDSHCLYSNGRKQRECKVKTFRRWARKVQAAIGGGSRARRRRATFSPYLSHRNHRSRPVMQLDA